MKRLEVQTKGAKASPTEPKVRAAGGAITAAAVVRGAESDVQRRQVVVKP